MCQKIYPCVVFIYSHSWRFHFSYYRFHHIHGIQDKHLRVDAEGHCHVLQGAADWHDGRGWLYTRHVPAEGEDPLAGIHPLQCDDLCAHHGVSTHYYCSEES